MNKVIIVSVIVIAVSQVAYKIFTKNKYIALY